MVLPLLQDSSRDIREALHELICYTNVSTKECIQLALLELLKNLSKYPTDRNSVWKYDSLTSPLFTSAFDKTKHHHNFKLKLQYKTDQFSFQAETYTIRATMSRKSEEKCFD